MKTKSFLKIACFDKVAVAFAPLAAGFLISGCASTGYHEKRGTFAGAATGAVIGTIIGNPSGEPGEGAAVGAAAGALSVEGRDLVEMSGIEPPTSALRTQRSPS